MEIGTAIDTFICHCRYERGLAEKTLKAYQTDLHQFSAHLIETHKIAGVEGIGRDQIRGFLQDVSADYAPRTIRRKIASLRAFLSFLEFEDIITVSPVRKMTLTIRAPKELPRTIPIRDIKRLFEALYQKKTGLHTRSAHGQRILLRDLAIVELLFATGMRVSEVAGLTLDRLDLTRGIVHVLGKGSRERVVPICAKEVTAALKEYLKVRGGTGTTQAVVFLNRHLRAMSEQSIRFMVRKYTKMAGIGDHITPHMFRHTMATALLENGMDIRYIQDLLGHSSIVITQIYAHVTADVRKREMHRRHPRKRMEFGAEQG